MIPVRFGDPSRASPEGSRRFKLALCAEPEPSPLPRMCHLKRLEGQNFGFYLQADQSGRAPEVLTVEQWSPAELSGLREGDRVLEVNEDFVDKMDFHKVGVQSSAELTIHRFSPDTDETFRLVRFNFADPGDTSSCRLVGGEEDPVLWIKPVPDGAEQRRLSAGTVGPRPSVPDPVIMIKALST